MTTIPNIKNGNTAQKPNLMDDEVGYMAGGKQYGMMTKANFHVISFYRSWATWTRSGTTMTVTLPNHWIDATPAASCMLWFQNCTSRRTVPQSTVFQDNRSALSLNINLVSNVTTNTFDVPCVNDGDTSGNVDVYQGYDLEWDAAALAEGTTPIVNEDDHWVNCQAVTAGASPRLYITGNTEAIAQKVIFSAPMTAWPPVFSQQTYNSTPWGAIGSPPRWGYSHFHRFGNNGPLVYFGWCWNANGGGGRVWHCYYLPVGANPTTGWLPVVPGTSPQGWLVKAIATEGAWRVYLTDVVIDQTGATGGGPRMWVGGTWRLEDADPQTHHDGFVMYTDVLGSNGWKTVTGTAVPIPLGYANRGIPKVNPAPTWGTMDGLAVDEDGYPCVLHDNGSIAYGGGLSDGSPPSLMAPPSEQIRIDWDGTQWVPKRVSVSHLADRYEQHRIRDDLYVVSTSNGVSPGAGATGGSARLKMHNNRGMVSSTLEDEFGTFTASRQTAYIGHKVIYNHVGTAGTSERWRVMCDPIARDYHERIDMLIPDGDIPMVYSFGGGYRCRPIPATPSTPPDPYIALFEAYDAAVIAASPEAYWPLWSDTSGAVVDALAGSDGTYVNSPLLQQTIGGIPRVVQTDGTSSFLTCPFSASDIEREIICAVHLTSVGSNPNWPAIRDNSSASLSGSFMAGTPDSGTIANWWGRARGRDLTANGIAATTGWHLHDLFVRKTTGNTEYRIDNVNGQSNGSSNTDSWNSPFHLGRNGNSSAYVSAGLFGFAIFPVKLTDPQRLAIYNAYAAILAGP